MRLLVPATGEPSMSFTASVSTGSSCLLASSLAANALPEALVVRTALACRPPGDWSVLFPSHRWDT